MSASEKFWTRVCQITYTILVVFSIYQVYKFVDEQRDISVPITVSNTYAQGYHGKHSVGEDYHVVGYNDTYGLLNIDVSYTTFINLKKGDQTSFILNKVKIDRYSYNTDLADDLMPLYLTLATFVLGYLVYLICSFVYKHGIVRFNNFLDNKFG